VDVIVSSDGSAAEHGIAAIYRDKPATYFANARLDFVDRLRTGSQSAVLELGCGAGGTGRAVLAAGKAGRYVGLELDPSAARVAAEVLTEVVVGDVQATDLTRLEGQFDALIISEVLEHLTDPWTSLGRLAACLKPGAQVLASSPNIAHWNVIRNLLRGRFEYGEAGVMDQTHLRWFTPSSYVALFEGAGLKVESVSSMRARDGWKARLFNALTGGRMRHLFMAQVVVMARKP
jgi:2-polyprenyl-3-methyl-5-hydroxy-6-metoxy-1,4-benzoquinol methylase